MRHAAFVLVVLMAAGCRCRRTESVRSETVGSAVITHVRTCEMLDWESGSCRTDSVMTVGSVRIPEVGNPSPSPTGKRALVGMRDGTAILVDTGTGEIHSRFPVFAQAREWCGDSELIVTSPLALFEGDGYKGTTLELVWFESDTEIRRAVVHKGLRNVPRVLCGPGHTMAFALEAEKRDGAPELYRWSQAEGLQLVETWPGPIEGGDPSDLVLSWSPSGRPDWCARSRPYDLNRCVPPTR
ncbi:hypothetical protein [Pyxidicoccus trucidator]|uniref:hypothetical protein n=1 Tax=Pyxidicoccus trucidator TaxID=2709662 RepID=UPI0013DCE30A|nr:hypothetical protein [Pyxidicoccus trucidator]